MPQSGITIGITMNMTFTQWAASMVCKDVIFPKFGLCYFLAPPDGVPGRGSGMGENNAEGSDERGTWYEWVMTYRIVFESWWGDGLFGIFGRVTSWASTQVCMIVLGKRSCDYVRTAVTLAFAVLILAGVLYGLDWLFRPLVYLVRRGYRLYRWCFGYGEDVAVGVLEDCEWRGPGAEAAVDNDFYRNVIRMRSIATRKPNHLLIQVDGAYARCSRSGARLRQISRFGQLWEATEVVSASSQALRRTIDGQPGKMICLCREMNYPSRPCTRNATLALMLT